MAADSLAKSRLNLNVSHHPGANFKKLITIDSLLCKISIYFVQFVTVSCAHRLQDHLNSHFGSSLS